MGAMLRLFSRRPFVDVDERRQVRGEKGAKEEVLLLEIRKGLTKNFRGAIPTVLLLLQLRRVNGNTCSPSPAPQKRIALRGVVRSRFLCAGVVYTVDFLLGGVSLRSRRLSKRPPFPLSAFGKFSRYARALDVWMRDLGAESSLVRRQ